MNTTAIKPAPAGIGRNMLIYIMTAVASVAMYYLLPADMNELSRRTATIFLAAAILWSTEALPLYATSLCVLGLEILFLAADGGIAGILPARSAMPLKPGGSDYLQFGAVEFLKSFSSPIIVLFLGAFLLSAAVTKHGLDRVIAARVLQPFISRPKWLIFAILGITAFFSMWMSNTATTAMMLAIVAPLMRALPDKDTFHRAVILAVPFGANVGGIGTPIGTPPNAVALAALRMAGYQIGFLDWMVFAVPLMLCMLVLTGIVLLWFFPPDKDLVLPAFDPPKKLTFEGRLSIIILVIAIVLWLTGKWHGIADAVVALLAAAALTAMRVLDRKDVDSIDWNVLILMWGGLSLGHAMNVTGLVEYVIHLPVIGWIQTLPEFTSHMVMAGFVLTLTVGLASFMSHTAAAALIVPMAMALSPQEGGMLAILCALASSFAMAMPVSTPPNAMAFASGRVPATSMIRSGGLISFASIIVLLAGHRAVLPMFMATSSADIEVSRRIAVLVPMTGERKEAGQTQMDGYEQVAESLRRAGIAVRYFDTGATTEPIGDLLFQTVRPWKPDVIVGPYHSEAAMQLVGALAGDDPPLIVPTANVDQLTQRAKSKVYRLAPPTQIMAMTLADFIKARRDMWSVERVTVVHEATSFGRDSAQAVAGACLMRGIEVGTPITFPEGRADQAASTLEVATPQSALLVLVARATEDAQALVARFAPAGARMIGFSGGFATLTSEQLLQGAKVDADRLFVVTPWSSAADAATAFDLAFSKQHGSAPNYRTAQAAAAITIAGKVIEESLAQRTTPDDLLGKLVFQTPVGPVRFINFGGYYRQNPAGAVVVNVATGMPEPVWPQWR